MIKKVFRPFWSYDVIKNEEWLSWMAEKGYFLVKINRVTRHFFFQQDVPKKVTYRIGFDKMQGDSLPKGLVEDGWTKVFRSGNWYVTANELEQIKKSPVREGIIKHNRLIMYIFAGILFYLTASALFFLMIFSLMFFSDSPGEVVESPYWIITYLYFASEIVIWALSLYSVIKISKTNKKLLREKGEEPNRVGLDIRKLRKAEEKRLKQTGQLVVKRKFGWMYSPDKLEKWLEDREGLGFNLYRVSKNGTAFYFFKGSPRKMSYCTDYQNIVDESYFDIHKDSGWKCVFNSFSSLQKWTIWSREYSEGEERPQIFSDKSNHLKHAKRIAIAYTCLFLPMVIVYILNIGLSMELMYQQKVNTLQITNMVLFLLLIIMFGSYSVRTWLYYMRLKKQYL